MRCPIPHLLLLLCLPAATLACPPLPPDAAASLPLALALARVPDCHPAVRTAQGALAQAGADVITAGQRPNPQLTVGAGEVSRRLGSGSLWDKTFDHSAGVEQVIERGDKPALRRSNAERLQRAARADTSDARRQARAEVAATYFDLAAALAKRQQLRDSALLSAQSQQAAERRARAGDAPALDATRVGLDATRAQVEANQADADAEALRVRLATLIGAEDVAAALTPATDFDTAGTALPDDPAAVAAAIDRRPDVAAAVARLAATEGAAALAQAQRTRDVTVGMTLSRYPTSATNSSGSGNTVSLTVAVPLFVHHAYEGEIARAEADRFAAEEALRRVRLAAQADVARARSAFLAADTRKTIVDTQLLPAAERVAAGAELAYRRGASGVLDILDARRALRAAQLERITSAAERAKAAAAYEAALSPIEATP